MSKREYPDITFLETDTEIIESNMIALYEYMMKEEYKREDYKMQPASPERVFIAWCAAIIVQQRILIEETAKKKCATLRRGGISGQFGRAFQRH